MCGIVGAFKPGGASCGPDVVARMRDRMAHRGPDGVGVWTSADRSATLGHRRLSIIDLSTAALQPMLNAAGTVAVVFNEREHLGSQVPRENVRDVIESPMVL